MVISSIELHTAISCLCQDVLSSNEHISFVCALNKKGRVIEAKLKHDRVVGMLSKQQIEMLYMQRTLQTSLCMEFDDVMGSLNYITLHRETFFEFIFPYSEGVFFMIADLDVLPHYLGKKIMFMLRDFDWRIKNPIFQ